jgi:hypothetical protein
LVPGATRVQVASLNFAEPFWLTDVVQILLWERDAVRGEGFADLHVELLQMGDELGVGLLLGPGEDGLERGPGGVLL